MIASEIGGPKGNDPMPKFRVTGSNKDTSARMTLELVAASKGDAERKAAHAGMIVSHVAPVQENAFHTEEHQTTMAKSYKQEENTGNTKKLVIVFIVLLAVFLFTGLVWPGFWN
jgi:hypothetical protein